MFKNTSYYKFFIKKNTYIHVCIHIYAYKYEQIQTHCTENFVGRKRGKNRHKSTNHNASITTITNERIIVGFRFCALPAELFGRKSIRENNGQQWVHYTAVENRVNNVRSRVCSELFYRTPNLRRNHGAPNVAQLF